MRACQLVVVLLVVCLSSASALRCNHCSQGPAGGRCSNTVETCSRIDEVCATVVMTSPRFFAYRRCMKQSDAFILNASSQSIQVFTCSTDLCN